MYSFTDTSPPTLPGPGAAPAAEVMQQALANIVTAGLFSATTGPVAASLNDESPMKKYVQLALRRVLSDFHLVETGTEGEVEKVVGASAGMSWFLHSVFEAC